MIRNDYRVTVKVRNNNIIEAIESMGDSPGQKWCNKNGFSYNHLVKLINMQMSPIDGVGRLKPCAEKLCAITYSTPDELWCDEQLTPLENNKANIKMKPDQVRALMWADRRAPALPDDGADYYFIEKTVAEVLNGLTNRERDVVRMRFGLSGCSEMTLDEIGLSLGVSGARVRQIEAKALRKMRIPSRAESLVQCL